MSPITLGNILTANRLCEKRQPAMSRPWTRATELQYRKAYKLYFSVFLMVGGLVKKIALAGMVGASAMFGAKEVEAVPIPWNSISDITYDARIYPDGNAADYVSGSITFRDENGNVIANNPSFSLVYIVNTPSGSSGIAGGLDGFGSSASGWFNQRSPYDIGLVLGQTANQTEENMDDGYWEAFIDLNGDGRYGTYDSSTGLFIADPGERIHDFRVSNFQGFQTGAGSLSAGDFSGWYYAIPEPSSALLLALGAGALDGTNIIRLQIAVTNLSSFRLECRDSLTNTVWASLGTFAATGAVTEVSDTNTVPTRFYRVVSP